MEELDKNSDFWLEVLNNISSGNISIYEPTTALNILINANIDKAFDISENFRGQIYNALQDDVEFLNDFHCKKYQGLVNLLTIEEKDKVTGLLIWVLTQFNSWNEDDPLLKKVTLAFIILGYFSENFYQYLKLGCINNNGFIEKLSSLIKNFCFKVDYKKNKKIPVWEGEAICNYQEAIENKNWMYLSDNWHIFRHIPSLDYGNFFQNQIFLLLLKFNKEALLNGINEYFDFFGVMSIVNKQCISVFDKLDLALNTNNDIFRFCLLFSFELKYKYSSIISELEKNTLAQVFDKISKEPYFFEWMSIFNKFPTRYMIFAEGFGEFLAKYSNESSQGCYLDSIEFSKYSSDINYFTRLFISFRDSASIEKRKLFWTKCYKKWLSWDFGSTNEKFFLGEIMLSDFNYAVVCYYAECLNENERNNIQAEVLQKIDEVFLEWCNSKSEQMSQFYKYLSLLQPIAHAIRVSSDPKISLEMNRSTLYSSTTFNEDQRYKKAFNLEKFNTK